MYWEKYSHSQIKAKVFECLSKNTNYRTEAIIGIPATYLDSSIFYEDAPFLKDAPFLSTLIANPNHIGVHTLGSEQEDFFTGTQEMEKEVIKICAEEIFKAEPQTYDGYVASGGTEANIEALWIYRNYFTAEFKANIRQIAVIYSEDTHYSIPKGIDLLNLQGIEIAVNLQSRTIDIHELEQKVNQALANGVNYFIVNVNMSTTMFGSVDDIDAVTDLLNALNIHYKLHVDAAFGGFIYPFIHTHHPFHFKNENISSFSLDGHKMLQAPYGTGIFLIRKHLLKYVCTNEANYVKGKDFTLCGSRSGANAVCLWMILHTHGSVEWTQKMQQLISRTSFICQRLDALQIRHFRNPYLNIVTINANYISERIAEKFHLVPDTHTGVVNYYKIVVMPHVEQAIINDFLSELEKYQSIKLM